MNDIPVRIARELIKIYGSSLMDDPERLGQLLEDRCGEFRHEIFVLCFALREISKRGNVPSFQDFTETRGDIEKQLRANLGFDKTTSAWAAGAIEDMLLDAETSDSSSPEPHIEARRGFLDNIGLIGRSIARKPRTAPMRKKVLRNGLLLIGILALFLGLFVRMTESRYNPSGEHKVLFLAHLSGAEAGMGHIRLKAAQLAADEVNAAGGIKRKILKLQANDMPTSPEEAARTLAALVRDRSITAMISACNESVNTAIARLSDEYELPLIVTESSGFSVTMASWDRPWLYSFRTGYDNAYKGKLMAYFAAQGLKRNRAALLTDLYDRESAAIGDSFAEWNEIFGGELVHRSGYTKRGALDHAGALEIMESGPDIVVIANTAPDVSSVVQMLRLAGYENAVLGISYNDSMQANGGRNLDDTWWIVPASPDDSQLQSFQAGYRDRYNETIPRDDFAGTILAYDSVKWMADALYRAPGFQGEALRHAFLSTRNLPLAHATLTVDPRTHSPWNKAAALIYCSEGRGRFQKRFSPR